MSAALLVILIVLVVEGARAEPSAHAVGFVFIIAALLLVRGWLLLISSARESARRDPLTGVYDEPHLHDQLRRLTAAARQYAEPFALVLMNVSRRHADEALGRLVGTARELDLVARLDDGRLAVVLARISEHGAAEAAERLRAGVQTAATAGVAVWRPGDTAADVVDKAERLLDAALQLGGNHTRGPKPDVLVYGHPRLGVTAFTQLLELATAIDVRYRIAPAHSRKVARVARDLALTLELKPEAVAASYLGGLLHALGTLPLDESALRPHGALTALDAKLELHHGTRGAELVGRIPCAAHVAKIVGQLRGALGRRRAASRARRVDPLRGADRRGRERDRDDDRARRRCAAADVVLDRDLAPRRRPLRPRDRQRPLPARPRRRDRRPDRGGSCRRGRSRGRAVSRSPCAAPRSSPRRSRGSSGRGRGARSRTRP